MDYLKDYNLFKNIIDEFKDNIYTVKMNEILRFLDKNPELTKYQKKIRRNQKLIDDLKRDEI